MTVNREPEPEDEELLRAFARRYFPEGDGPTLMLKTCMFTNSPDRHFILDRHPDASGGLDRGRVLRPRLQVLQRDRRGDGGPGPGRTRPGTTSSSSGSGGFATSS